MIFRKKMKDQSKKLIKYYLLIYLVISIISVFLLSSCMEFGLFTNRSSQTTDEGIKTFVVTRGDILQEITITGSVDAKNSNEYSFQVSGQIISALERGDSFRKGDILVELDNSEGLSKIEQLEAELQSAEDDIISAKSSLATARINYQNALDANHFAIQLAEINTQKSEQATASALASLESANINADLAYEKAESALEKATTEKERSMAELELESTKASGNASTIQAEVNYEKSLLDQSTTYWNNLSNLYSAQSQLKLAKENINQTAIKVNQAERKVETAKQNIETAKEDLDDYKIYAPYDGIVVSTGYKTGEHAGTGGTGISIISNKYIIRSTVNEIDISKIKIEDEVIIYLDAYPNIQINGKLEKIIPLGITSGGIVSYDVLISFNELKDIAIFYGLSADASIIIAKAENVLYVPIQAVYKENGKSYVDVLETGQQPMKTFEQPTGQTSKQKTEQKLGQPPEQSFEQSTGLAFKQQSEQPSGLPEQKKQANISPKDIANNIKQVEVTTGIYDYTNIEIKSGLKEGDIVITSRIKSIKGGN